MNEPRLPWTRIAPEAYRAMAAVNAATDDLPLGPTLSGLVQTRVSQLNGCAFCVDMHARELRQRGESWQRINSLATWRQTGLYSQRERAALDWAETLTRLVEHHDGRDGEFDALKRHFSDPEIVALCWTIARINAWNRLSVGMRNPVLDKPIE